MKIWQLVPHPCLTAPLLPANVSQPRGGAGGLQQSRSRGKTPGTACTAWSAAAGHCLCTQMATASRGVLSCVLREAPCPDIAFGLLSVVRSKRQVELCGAVMLLPQHVASPQRSQQ